jgi:hypothetical protein
VQLSLPDALGYDALTDELATDPDREFSRPSLYPSCRAFVAATAFTYAKGGADGPLDPSTVAGISSPATRSATAKAEPDTTATAGSPPRRPVVSPSLEGLPDE